LTIFWQIGFSCTKVTLGTEKPTWASPRGVRIDGNDDVPVEPSWRDGVYDPATGFYMIGGVRPGRYRIEIAGYLGSNSF